MYAGQPFCFNPIGTIHSPFKQPEGMPIQPAGARGVKGTVEVFPEYAEGLDDLEGFSRVILLFVFDRSPGFDLTVTPFLDTVKRGVFATRAPRRPVPIGLSIVRLIGVKGNILQVGEIDVCDGTPLLDIKPYVPAFDSYPEERTGWLSRTEDRISAMKADKRFMTE